MPTPGRKPAVSHEKPAPHGDGAIASLTVRPHRTDRTVVVLEDGSAFELASLLVERAGLSTGSLLTEDARERLIGEDEPLRARSRALHLLALSDRTQREVETRLRDLGFGQESVADATAWLASLGYLDDRRFAERYVAEKLRAGWGPRRIFSDLLRKGVERALVGEMLDAAGPNGPNTQALVEGSEAMLALVRRRFGKQFAVDPDGAERRMAGYLARRGYDWETIGRVARELRAESGGGGAFP
jgi:regulatory protein